MNGIRKITKYSVLKKILLIGFFISSIFITYSVCSIKASITIDDTDFIEIDKNYLQVRADSISVETFLKCEKLDCVDYVLPQNSLINLKMKFDDYNQTTGYICAFEGSLLSVDILSDNDIIKGRKPQNASEIVLDKMIYDRLVTIEDYNVAMMGVKDEDDILDKKVFVDNMKDFTIVGFVDRKSPSIYTDKSIFINLINNSNRQGVYDNMISSSNIEEQLRVQDYKLFLEDIKITKGRFPENDYEVIINQTNKEEDIDIDVNNTKLTVVGYYDSKTNNQEYLVNNNTVKYNLLNQKFKKVWQYNPYYDIVNENTAFMVYPKDKEKALTTIKKEYNLVVKDKYEEDKNRYLKNKKEDISNSLFFSGLALVISLIEIYLIVRASFLSRIREIGTLRVIGVKRKDIVNIFLGEIIAITTCISMLGVISMTYILNIITNISELKNAFIINSQTIGTSVLIIYLFNIIFGLLPLFNILRKKPAEIFARTDVE